MLQNRKWKRQVNEYKQVKCEVNEKTSQDASDG